jgi:DNA primase
VDAAEVVGRDVVLHGRGRVRKGLCPFHPDRRPSLAVYPDGWKCFGCGRHGDHVDWLMDHRGLEFPEAVQVLRSLVGVSALPTDPRTSTSTRPPGRRSLAPTRALALARRAAATSDPHEAAAARRLLGGFLVGGRRGAPGR